MHRTQVIHRSRFERVDFVEVQAEEEGDGDDEMMEQAPQPGIQDSTTESSSSINAVKLKTTVEKEDLIDNAIPSYGCESSSTHGETNTSSETLVGDTVPDVHVESKSEDESKPNASRKCDEATESYDKVCTMSKIPGAPTPFNSPTFGTSKTSETNMEDVIDNLNI
ncbi:hypothetical protein IFR04_006915 [Cadophora malorum]|uniref:Uncharacterized protein n=1 Tax=Cadophora malorum TaxID=108018 RepID=A0A8H7TIV3_9HELO|nr:hypothetical protein IFR04_006915 [Cadophora malorum]